MTSSKIGTLSLAHTVGRDAGTLVVGLAETTDGPVLVGLPDDVAKAFTKTMGRSVEEVAASLGATTKLGRTTFVCAPSGLRVVVVGLGPIDVTPEQVRRAAGSAVRAVAALDGAGPHAVTISLDTTEPEIIKGAAEGALLGSYSYRPHGAGVGAITLVSSNRKAEARRAVELASVVAEAVVTAREWVNTPANLLYPGSFAEAARVLARDAKVTCDVLDEKALEKEGFGGILAVGGGSAHKPRLVKLSYAPRGARFHLGLVGKGITFDAGGLNLKTADGMYTMKSDMAGAAAVLAATVAVAKLGLKVRVTAYASMAENLPSATAYRPSDVLTMYGGRTVENGNSDAEGRIVLADALAKCSQDGPDLVLDVATLTGACIVALGDRVAGLMARDDETADLVLDAAEAAGELFWQLPIPEETLGKLDSLVADIRTTADRPGGALTAAAFLSTFVPETTPWAHLDIAGPAFNDKDAYDYTPAGGTGVAVRTLIALAHAQAS